jgi:hypothetical protein
VLVISDTNILGSFAAGIDLPLLLRLLWKRKIVSPTEVRTLIDKMKAGENLQLRQEALTIIFPPS